ncbi:MAG: hypothetical protein EXS31_16225 [Pedosphaera sp.]|nr:hypothetical protein [Pedosphaera sp.]
MSIFHEFFGNPMKQAEKAKQARPSASNAARSPLPRLAKVSEWTDTRKMELLDLGGQAAGVLHRFVLMQNAIRTWKSLLFEHVDFDTHEREVEELSAEFGDLIAKLETLARVPSPNQVESDYIHALGCYLCDVENAVSQYSHLTRLIKFHQNKQKCRGAIAVWKARREFNRRVDTYQQSGTTIKTLWTIFKNIQNAA